MWFRIFWLFVLVTLIGCMGGGSLLDSVDYPTTEPSVADLTGDYLPTAETLKDIRERGQYPEREMSIRLSAEGTFTATNIPDWWMDESSKPGGGFITTAGNWKPDKFQEWWRVDLRFTAPTQTRSENGTFSPLGGDSFILVGTKPPYTLRIILGDPDRGRVMDFTKPE